MITHTNLEGISSHKIKTNQMTRKKETHYRCKVNKYQEPHNFPNCLFLISYTICSHLNYVELHHSLMVGEYFLLFCKNLNENPVYFIEF